MNIKNMLLGPTKAEIKIVGVSNYTSVVSRLTEGTVVLIDHEPTNPHDGNAMRITLDGETLGYLPRVIAERIITEMPERSFVGHITYTTHHDGQTVGGALVVDKSVEGGEPAPIMQPATTHTATTVKDRPVF